MISEEEFLVRVDLVRRELPGHPLLPQLNKYSRIACIYLKHAMRGLELPAKGARPQVQSIDDEQSEYEDDPQYIDLQNRKSQLYGRRFNLSNQFHDVITDRHACANISDEIRMVQNKIAAVQRQIAHFRRTGELIEEAPEQEREYSGLALAKRIHTVTQNIRRWRSRIDREGMHQTPLIQDKWSKKLRDYEYELEGLRAAERAESL